MTDDTTSGEPRAAASEARPADPPRSAARWSSADPMAVPTTAPLWTYQQLVEPPAAVAVPLNQAPVSHVVDEPLRRRSPALGVLSLLLAIAAGVVEIAGVGVSVSGDFGTGTVLAFVAIGASVAAVVIGIVAAILAFGRSVGIVGAVLGLMINPLVLVWLLGILAGTASID